MIVRPAKLDKLFKIYNNKGLIDNDLWQKPTGQQKKLLLDKNFADEGSMVDFFIAMFFTICLLGNFCVEIENNTIDDIGLDIIANLIIIIPFWGIYLSVKYKEKILKDAIKKEDFTVLTNVIITDYIIKYNENGPSCKGFLIEVAGEQYKIKNFSGNENHNKDNKELEFNKVILVKVNVKSGIFKKYTKSKLKLFFYN